MTLATHDLTEDIQLALRFDTGTYPGMFALSIWDDKAEESVFMEWDKALEMADWILEQDKRLRK